MSNIHHGSRKKGGHKRYKRDKRAEHYKHMKTSADSKQQRKY